MVRHSDHRLACFRSSRATGKGSPLSPKNVKVPYPESAVQCRLPSQETPKKKADKEKSNKEREGALAQLAAGQLRVDASEKRLVEKYAFEKTVAAGGKGESGAGRPSLSTPHATQPRLSLPFLLSPGPRSMWESCVWGREEGRGLRVDICTPCALQACMLPLSLSCCIRPASACPTERLFP